MMNLRLQINELDLERVKRVISVYLTEEDLHRVYEPCGGG